MGRDASVSFLPLFLPLTRSRAHFDRQQSSSTDQRLNSQNVFREPNLVEVEEARMKGMQTTTRSPLPLPLHPSLFLSRPEHQLNTPHPFSYTKLSPCSPILCPSPFPRLDPPSSPSYCDVQARQRGMFRSFVHGTSVDVVLFWLVVKVRQDRSLKGDGVD